MKTEYRSAFAWPLEGMPIEDTLTWMCKLANRNGLDGFSIQEVIIENNYIWFKLEK